MSNGRKMGFFGIPTPLLTKTVAARETPRASFCSAASTLALLRPARSRERSHPSLERQADAYPWVATVIDRDYLS
jgi:hypothetical protein